ncbi:HNH endonuclease signature motif containing protein [Kineosporia sp. A_224]|uniref:HNH endonuclease signature motif containing protein n=1 Tax=Kineosporia sp. A_224 TaxID=1962180 RepID=UPI000B4AB173|nr:HNH endonuclease signature motif containing protein [Kineosporia sp. A_224]
MVERVSQRGAGVGDAGLGAGLGDLLAADPLGGVIRLTAVDLADCPGEDEARQWALADAHARRLVDQWWADPGAAQRDWDADLDALSAQVAADDRRGAVERRVALDGAPGLGSFAVVLEVLDGAAAWTPGQAAVEGFVDELADGAISGFAAARRVENHALWLQVALAAKVVRAFIGRTPSLPRRTRSGRLLTDDQDVLVDGSVALELAVAAGITQGRAAALVDAATALVIAERLPLTAQVLEQGRLDWPRLRMVVSRTRALTAEAVQAVERLLYATPGLLDGGTRRFDTALTAAVLAVDADAEARRRRRNRKGRRVSIQTTDDGAALFTAVGPGEAVTAAYNGLDAAARYLRQHGDPRTLDQLRHDLFVTGCTSGYLPVPADVLPVPPGCVPTGSTTAVPGPAATSTTGPDDATSTSGPSRPRGTSGSAASADAEAGAGSTDADAVPEWFTTTWPDVQVAVNVTVSAETLMGLVNDPGTLQGYGPIPADAVRDLARNGVFRCLVVDGEHGTVLGVGKNTFSPGYVASERLKLLLEHAHPTCTGPHCEKASWRCDVDHQTPYAQGGATCECNTRPLCRACHRLKTAGLLVPQRRHRPGEPPGTTTWFTRTGRTWTALPHAPLPSRSSPARTSAGPQDPPPF